MVLEKFMEKLEFASAEGIANAFGYLVNTKNFDTDVWNKLIKDLSGKEFEPGFSKVSLKAPFLFRYDDVSDGEFAYPSMGSSFVCDMFARGYKPVFDAVHYLSIALKENEKISQNATTLINDLNGKFELNDKAYNWEKFNAHLI